MFKSRVFVIIAVSLFLVQSCRWLDKHENERPKVSAATEIIADAAEHIGKDFVAVSVITSGGNNRYTGGVSESDIVRLSASNIVLFNGLYLEGRLQDMLKKTDSIPAVAVSAGVAESDLIKDDYQRGGYNPHFWMDVELWMKAVSYIADVFSKASPVNERIYRRNEELYLMKLKELDSYIRERTKEIPEEKRILITAHNAFEYFGRAYGFRTAALQQADTDYEISQADITRIKDFIIKNNIKTVFAEASVPQRNMLALRAALLSSGYEIKIGGTLYSDVLKKRANELSGYIETMKHNIDVIVNALIYSAEK